VNLRLIPICSLLGLILDMEKLRTVELFAGVGGFRLGLEGWDDKSATSGYTQPFSSAYRTVWSNQWEPSTKRQHASEIYVNRFGSEGHSNHNISDVSADEIPNHDLLCGGFPCQDYSVAKQLSKSDGIAGKKGVLWWDILRILDAKRPKYVFLENVDRLLKSPVKQRGRDFAIMLASLSDWGYEVEWRVINAADYGFPQRRKRVFIVGYQSSNEANCAPIDVIESEGIIARAFPIHQVNELMVNNFELPGDLAELTERFNAGASKSRSPFLNSGFMRSRQVWSYESQPAFFEKKKVLQDILLPLSEIPQEFILDENSMEKWEYLKGAKSEPRKKSNGEIFHYKEGPVTFPEPLDKASRTIITSEGGVTPSRFKLVVQQEGVHRRLIPIELERLNMFPDNHTAEASDNKRAFFMGNALVVGVIEKIGIEIHNHHAKRKVSYTIRVEERT
jgi:DNA (cytosine-5)-methyltransferase 1